MASFGNGRLVSMLAESDTVDYETLTGIRANTSKDGDETIFTVSYKNQHRHEVCVPYSLMGMLSHEVGYAARLMDYRQRLKLDLGVEKMRELCATAIRPASVEFFVEPDTGDRLLIFQFKEMSPLVLRMSPEEFGATLAKASATVAKAAH